jgi:CheY-like chemotaxis protein
LQAWMATERRSLPAAFGWVMQGGPVGSPTASCSGHEAQESSLRPNLLIVEDDPAMREVWQIVFGSRGWDVAVASTVAEGLASLDPPPDYLILDLSLPDGGGEAILRRVRDADLKTRVAVTTGTDDPARLRRVARLKPLNVADVWRDGMSARAG